MVFRGDHGQAVDLCSRVGNEIAKREVSVTEAVAELAGRSIHTDGVNVGKIQVAVGRKVHPAITGDYIELVMVNGVEGSPVVGDVPVGARRGFKLMEWTGEGSREAGKGFRGLSERGAMLQGVLVIYKPEEALPVLDIHMTWQTFARLLLISKLQ